MKLFEPLYARDSKAKILSWNIAVIQNPDGTSTISINEGLMDGKQTPTYNVINKGKNIGKMNETTPYDQAVSQAESRWNKKRKQGYKSLTDLGITLLTDLEMALPINRTDENNNLKPMKAQPYFKDNGEVRINFPCYGQPKLNGFRCIAQQEEVEEGEGLFKSKNFKVTFRSKEGLRYTILEHIEADVEKLLGTYNITQPMRLHLDGEMYIHGEILSEISSAVRKRNFKTPNLKFYVFDLAIPDMSQSGRLSILNTLSKICEERGVANVIIVPSFPIGNNEIAQHFTDMQIRLGYEGAIFRDQKAHYQFGKRPQTMTKLKRFQDKEFKIVDVVGGENSPEMGVFVCIAENGKTFKCTPEGTKEQKIEYLTNKTNYIGKGLTVRFFERTKDDLPFHAVGVDIRDYE